jgi:hypothetical protein
MKPEFPRVNFAIRSILNFYEIQYIEDYLDFWSGKREWWKEYGQNWFKYALKSFERMDDEIYQTIHTTNHNTQVELFELLKDWLTDYRIEQVAEKAILRQLDIENQNRLKRHEEEVEKKTEEYFQSEDRKHAHLEEYTNEVNSLLQLWWHPQYKYNPWWNSPEKEKKINYNFYCIKEEPDLISDEPLSQYFELVSYLIEKFKETLRPHMEKYNAGKIACNNYVTIQALYVEQPALPPAPFGEAKATNEQIIWQKNDTDLLEMITALTEIKSLQNKTGNLTRADAIKSFENFFGIEIKDAESKLVRATERKKSRAPFINSMKTAFEQYCENKNEK